MAVATQLGERISILILKKEGWAIVDSEQVVQGSSLEAEVVVVELNIDSDFLVEVAARSNLNGVACSQIIVRAACGQGKASAAEEGVLLRAVGIGAAVGVVGTAVAAAGRRLVRIVADAVVFGVGHLSIAGAA